MKKVFCFILCLSGIILCSHAQSAYRVSGTVCDTTRRAVDAATIALYSDSVMVNATVTDAKGHFVLDGVSKGKYKLYVSHLNYATYAEDLTVGGNIVTEIALKDEARTLGEVVVEGSRYSHSSNKEVFSIPGEVKKSSFDIYNALSTVPKLVVSPVEKTIKSIDGSSMIVLVDGFKRSASYVQAISPQAIDRVEIIHTPSMRYGLGEGQTTVLNIILKEVADVRYVVGLSAYAPVKGPFWMMAANARLTHKKFTPYAMWQTFRFHNDKQRLEEHNEFVQNGASVKSEYEGSSTFNTNMNYFEVGLDYTPSAKEIINLCYKNIHQKDKGEQSKWGNGAYFGSKTSSPFYSHNLELYYEKKFAGSRRFYVLSTYNNHGFRSDTDMGWGSDATAKLSGHQYLKNDKYSYSADMVYSFPIGKLNCNTGYTFYRQHTTLRDSLHETKYDQSKNYLFADMSGAIGKRVSFSLGLGMDIYYSKVADYRHNLVELLPSASLGYQFTDNLSADVSYKRSRFELPVAYIDPYVYDAGNGKDLRQGNPALKPFFDNTYQLNIVYKVKGWYLNPYISETSRNNNIGVTGRTTEDNHYLTTFDNLGHYDRLNVGMSVNKSLFKQHLQFNLNMGYTRQFFSTNTFSNEGFFYNLGMNAWYKRFSLYLMASNPVNEYTIYSKTKGGINESTFALNYRASRMIQLGVMLRWLGEHSTESWTKQPGQYNNYTKATYLDRTWACLFCLQINLNSKKSAHYGKKLLQNQDNDVRI